MRLEGIDGAVVNLRIVGYQFPEMAGGDWDSNWLEISGSCSIAEGEWTFAGPQLTAPEAATISPWLDAVADGLVPAIPDPTEDWEGESVDYRGLLDFMEPMVAFSVRSRSDKTVQIRVHLSDDGLPPWVDREEPRATDRYRHFVTMSVTADGLRSAAEEWRTEAARFPPRYRLGLRDKRFDVRPEGSRQS